MEIGHTLCIVQPNKRLNRPKCTRSDMQEDFGQYCQVLRYQDSIQYWKPCLAVSPKQYWSPAVHSATPQYIPSLIISPSFTYAVHCFYSYLLYKRIAILSQHRRPTHHELSFFISLVVNVPSICQLPAVPFPWMLLMIFGFGTRPKSRIYIKTREKHYER